MDEMKDKDQMRNDIRDDRREDRRADDERKDERRMDERKDERGGFEAGKKGEDRTEGPHLVDSDETKNKSQDIGKTYDE